jgi:hypothetical protein
VADRCADGCCFNGSAIAGIALSLGRLKTDVHFHRARQRADGGAVPRVVPRAAVEITKSHLDDFRGNHLSRVGERFNAGSGVGELNRHLVAFEAGETLNAGVGEAAGIAIADGALQPGRSGNCEEVGNGNEVAGARVNARKTCDAFVAEMP